MTRGAGWIAAIFVVALGVAVELSVGAIQPLRVGAGDLLAGLALGGAGAAAIARAPRRWAGWWLVVAAVLWFAATLAADRHAVLRDVGEQAGLAYRGALITAVVLVCCHRHAPLVLGAAAAAWVDGLIPAVGRSTGASFALAALVLIAAAVADMRRAPIGWRVLPAVCLAAALAGPAAARELGQVADTGNRVLLGADLAIGLTAVLTALWIEVRTTDEILDLAGEGGLDHALGFALVDPGVRVLAPIADMDARAGRRADRRPRHRRRSDRRARARARRARRAGPSRRSHHGDSPPARAPPPPRRAYRRRRGPRVPAAHGRRGR